MFINLCTRYLLLILSTVHFSLCYAADIEKELRIKEQIIDYIMDGDPVMLAAGNHEFLSIYMESESDNPKGAVILMHGRGYHPNWPELIYPLRTGLPEHGWHTLSIQMPVLANDASFYDYLEILPESFPRIDSAIQYLRQQGITKIILLAHSCSVHMAVAWLEQNLHKNIAGFIGIGMGSTDKGQPMLRPFPLHKFSFPVLDIRGEHDYPAVITKAPVRWKNIQKAGNQKSEQRVVKNADHYFNGMGNVLLGEVINWLEQL